MDLDVRKHNAARERTLMVQCHRQKEIMTDNDRKTRFNSVVTNN